MTTPFLIWEHVPSKKLYSTTEQEDTGIDIRRAKVPGGWFVRITNEVATPTPQGDRYHAKGIEERNTAFFYPDPQHAWALETTEMQANNIEEEEDPMIKGVNDISKLIKEKLPDIFRYLKMGQTSDEDIWTWHIYHPKMTKEEEEILYNSLEEIGYTIKDFVSSTETTIRKSTNTTSSDIQEQVHSDLEIAINKAIVDAHKEMGIKSIPTHVSVTSNAKMEVLISGQNKNLMEIGGYMLVHKHLEPFEIEALKNLLIKKGFSIYEMGAKDYTVTIILPWVLAGNEDEKAMQDLEQAINHKIQAIMEPNTASLVRVSSKAETGFYLDHIKQPMDEYRAMAAALKDIGYEIHGTSFEGTSSLIKPLPYMAILMPNRSATRANGEPIELDPAYKDTAVSGQGLDHRRQDIINTLADADPANTFTVGEKGNDIAWGDIYIVNAEQAIPVTAREDIQRALYVKKLGIKWDVTEPSHHMFTVYLGEALKTYPLTEQEATPPEEWMKDKYKVLDYIKNGMIAAMNPASPPHLTINHDNHTKFKYKKHKTIMDAGGYRIMYGQIDEIAANHLKKVVEALGFKLMDKYADDQSIVIIPANA